MASSSIPAGGHVDPTRRDFLMVATGAMGAIGTIAVAWPFINNLNPAADTLALYGEFDAMSSVAFYTDRQLLLWNGRYNNLAPGSYYPDAPHLFLTDPEFLALWHGPKRVFLFVPPEHRAAAAQRLPAAGTYLLAESGGKAVYANQPSVAVATAR